MLQLIRLFFIGLRTRCESFELMPMQSLLKAWKKRNAVTFFTRYAIKKTYGTLLSQKYFLWSTVLTLSVHYLSRSTIVSEALSITDHNALYVTIQNSLKIYSSVIYWVL